jgi:hypothetical protein
LLSRHTAVPFVLHKTRDSVVLCSPCKPVTRE